MDLTPDTPVPPESSDAQETNRPYTPSEPGSLAPKLTNSSFKSRTLTPLDPVTPLLQPTPQENPLVQAEPQPEPAVTESVVPATAFVGSDVLAGPDRKAFTPIIPIAGAQPKRSFSFRSKPVIGGAAVLVLLIGFAAYYFGYKTNPSVIYKQSLSNSSKGYDKLVSYIDKQSTVKYKGTTGSGSFSYKSGSFSTDGNLDLKSDNNNAQLKFDIGLVGSRLSTETRLIQSSSGGADIYIKASGLKGLGALAGSPQLDTALTKLDDSWVVIDHTLIDSLGSGSSASNMSSQLPPTQAQILDEAKVLGKVNNDYLFTTDKDKAILKVTNNIGTETIDGHKTYHYRATLQKDNVKAYIAAQKAALQSSKLHSWIKGAGLEASINSSFDSLSRSAESIKASDTVDIWADSSQRILYKVRFSDRKNSASNFVDVGLDYRGGNSFPLFIETQNKAGSITSIFKTSLTLNTKTNETGFKLDFNSGGQDSMSIGLSMNIKPSNEQVKIDKPASAKTFTQVLSDLGYGDIQKQLQAASAAKALNQ
jgi:hypothetical protein